VYPRTPRGAGLRAWRSIGIPPIRRTRPRARSAWGGAYTMILEVAEITIRPGTQFEFEAAIRRGVETVIAHSPGFRRYEVQHGIESPERYLLMIEWETLENHTVDFRGSPAFGRWRELVGPFFAQPPQVEHYVRCAGG
jgi:heme-degrading monooxygenase HmoA